MIVPDLSRSFFSEALRAIDRVTSAVVSRPHPHLNDILDYDPPWLKRVYEIKHKQSRITPNSLHTVVDESIHELFYMIYIWFADSAEAFVQSSGSDFGRR